MNAPPRLTSHKHHNHFVLETLMSQLLAPPFQSTPSRHFEVVCSKVTRSRSCRSSAPSVFFNLKLVAPHLDWHRYYIVFSHLPFQKMLPPRKGGLSYFMEASSINAAAAAHDYALASQCRGGSVGAQSGRENQSGTRHYLHHIPGSSANGIQQELLTVLEMWWRGGQ